MTFKRPTITRYLRLADGIFTDFGYALRVSKQCPEGLHPDAHAFFCVTSGRLIRVPGTAGETGQTSVIFLIPWARPSEAASALATLHANATDCAAWSTLLQRGAAYEFMPSLKQALFRLNLFGAARSSDANFAEMVAQAVTGLRVTHCANATAAGGARVADPTASRDSAISPHTVC